jgi:hypothetical protein
VVLKTELESARRYRWVFSEPAVRANYTRACWEGRARVLATHQCPLHRTKESLVDASPGTMALLMKIRDEIGQHLCDTSSKLVEEDAVLSRAGQNATLAPRIIVSCIPKPSSSPIAGSDRQGETIGGPQHTLGAKFWDEMHVLMVSSVPERLVSESFWKRRQYPYHNKKEH